MESGDRQRVEADLETLPKSTPGTLISSEARQTEVPNR